MQSRPAGPQNCVTELPPQCSGVMWCMTADGQAMHVEVWQLSEASTALCWQLSDAGQARCLAWQHPGILASGALKGLCMFGSGSVHSGWHLPVTTPRNLKLAA